MGVKVGQVVDIHYVLSIIHVANEDVNVSSGNFDVRFAPSNLHITTQRPCHNDFASLIDYS